MIRKTIVLILLLSLLCPVQCFASYNKEAADICWEILLEETNSEIISAGIMGYFQRESGFKASAIPHYYLFKSDKCALFTEELYGLNYEDFIIKIQAAAGYGLGQWYSKYHLEQFYNYFNENNYKYDDLEAQCKFTIDMIKNNKKLWEDLSELKTAEQAGRMIGYRYDGAREESCEVIASYAKKIYKERIES